MRVCVLCKSKNNPTDDISIHLFPKNEQMRQLWISAIGQDNFNPIKSAALCSQHFEKTCFFYPLGGEKKKRHIKPDAVPTIFGFHYSRKALKLNENTNEMQSVAKVTNVVNNIAVEPNNIVDNMIMLESVIVKDEKPNILNIENTNEMQSVAKVTNVVNNIAVELNNIVDNMIMLESVIVKDEKPNISNVENTNEVQSVAKVTNVVNNIAVEPNNIVDNMIMLESVIVKDEKPNISNVENTNEVQSVAKVTNVVNDMAVEPNIIDNMILLESVIVKDEKPNISNVDDSLENNQSNREFINDDSNARCNERNPQINVKLLESPSRGYCLNPQFSSEKDLTSPLMTHKLRIATETINYQRRKIRNLQKQVQRLKKKNTDMKSFIAELKKSR